MGRAAPNIDLGVLAALPDDAVAHLDARRADIAIQPLEGAPKRFATAPLYTEQFAAAVRKGHALVKHFSLERYCAHGHVLVSTSGGFHGAVDASLAELGMRRRVVLSAPNFLLALAIVAETDLVAAIPSRLLAAHAKRYNVDVIPAPLPWGLAELRAIIPRAALSDQGSAWLFDLLQKVCVTEDPAKEPPSKVGRRRRGAATPSTRPD